MAKQVFFNSSFFLICFFSITLLSSNIAFILGFDLHRIVLVIGFFISLLLLIFVVKKAKEIYVSVFLALLVIVISYFLAVLYFDTSWDGQGYHQESIYLIKNGWNPIYENSHAFSFWVNFYQKGNEIIQANIYLVTHKIESGKMFNLLMMYVSGVMVWRFIDTLALKDVHKVLISFIVIFNPVVVTQAFTYYVDGNWYLLLVTSFASLLLYFFDKKPQDLIVFVFSSVIFCSIKFSSIPIFIVFLFFAMLYHYLYQKRIMVLPYLSVLLLVGICNVHPFNNNLQRGSHILHPFYGEQKIDIINQNIPEVLLHKNRVERILISLFSKTTNDRKVVFSEAIKLPFSFSKEEVILSNDTKLGGFGFLFSGILVVSVLLALSLVMKRGEIDKKIMVLIASALLVSILVNPASWWPRLSAQIWLLPVFLMIGGLLSQDKISNWLSKVVLWVYMVNILVFSAVTLVKINYNTYKMHAFIDSIGHRTITLDLSHPYSFQQYYLKFKERNIKYKIGEVKGPKRSVPFASYIYYTIE
ncbi:hypothetical protein GCM10010992_20980 [Cloacibacterium rupense]|uniref:Dolichyl-phosphate-mannose-protein mannosyltransferase n=1 Tax=Cloacibacterium rupense TaxID=517423 RepID=A0ABQ2NMV7_9FLAO|nr:hypothetical protein [Cloacibacterium rupense]GGP05329.1 hypothetical protein GCM10010992_20980 [Cloacibacterium rupense]